MLSKHTYVFRDRAPKYRSSYFIQYTFGIRSMRKTMEEVKTNMAYRWFLGYGYKP